MEKEVLAYIAGIIDGEGTIFSTKRKDGKYTWYQQGIRVHMKYAKVPKWLHKHAGGNYYCSNIRANSEHMWTIHAKETRKLLPQIMPYLVEKKRQAEIILEWQKYVGKSNKNTPMKDQLWKELKSLHN